MNNPTYITKRDDIIQELAELSYTEGGYRLIQDFDTNKAAQAIDELVAEQVLKAKIAQTLRIHRHEFDVWTDNRDRGYFRAELKRLRRELRNKVRSE